MTERAAGADATGMQTSAVLDGDNYVLNGEKWFSSSASVADIAVVMAKTDPDAAAPPAVLDLHRRASQSRLRNRAQHPEVMHPSMTTIREQLGGTHSEIKIKNLIVPKPRTFWAAAATASPWASTVSPTGVLRHGMHNVAMRPARSRPRDQARHQHARRSATRLADRQGVQWMLADCASQLYMARLILLHIAYKAENGMDLRQENSIAKVFLAHMVHKVVDTALQLHGALGYSKDTPLAEWYTAIRSQRLVDGPDEVHRWRVGRNVIKAYEQFGTTAPAAGGDLL